MIYGFMTDEVFRPNSNLTISPTDMSLKDYGRLPDELKEYFNNELIHKDPRPERFKGVNDNKPIRANLQLHFDKSISEFEIEQLSLLGEDGWKTVFNIYEAIAYKLDVETVEEANLRLEAEKHTRFKNYAERSIHFSNDISAIQFYSNVNKTILVHKWVQFSLHTRDRKRYIPIKIWLHWDSFKNQYPISTIKKVVPPLNLETLANPALIPEGMQAAIESANLQSSFLGDLIHTDSFSDYIIYNTRYLYPDGKMIYIPFNILYKGTSPSTLSIRAAIRRYIEEAKILEVEQWRKRLPDLFVIGQFYLFPMWDNKVQRPTREQYCSITEMVKVVKVLDTLMPNMDTEYKLAHLEFLQAAFLESEVLVLQDPGNAMNLSLRDKHPSYQRYDPKNPSFNYQEENTRIFNSILNKALSAASGESIDKIFNITQVGSKKYISFVVNDLEFHVLTKQSYEEIMLTAG